MKHQDVAHVCTAIIKTFERPEKLLKLVGSIRTYYPQLPIMIIDDSKQAIGYEWDAYTTYKHVNYDIGLSAGRNMALGLVQTPYTLLLDDDFLFTEHTKIENFLSILENHPFDLVGGDVIDNGIQKMLFRGELIFKNNKLFLKYKIADRVNGQYPHLDFVCNFFMARTDLLLKSPWDEDLKINEHEYFFLCLKKIGGRVTYTPDVSIEHYPDLIDSTNVQYQKMRRERFKQFHTMACEKIGVKFMIHDDSAYKPDLWRFILEGTLGWTGLYTVRDTSMNAGPFGLFRIYYTWRDWMQVSDSIPAKCSKLIWRTIRPITRFIYHLWFRKK